MTGRTEVPSEFLNKDNDATEKQRAFIVSLAKERDIPEEARDQMLKRCADGPLTKRRASDFISRLLERPKLAQTLPAPLDGTRDVMLEARVPAGRYALRLDGVVKFYVVDKPTEGRWAGRTFLSAQASDEKHPIRASGAVKSILTQIAADPEAASLLYGRELGHCGVCGRTLTDETSRRNGIGPICAGRTGWGPREADVESEAVDITEQAELEEGEVTHCERCGETFGPDDSQAEVWNPADPGAASLLVHAEPCATEMIANGWEIA